MSPPDKIQRNHKRPDDCKYNLLELGVVPLMDPLLVGNGNTNEVYQNNQITIPFHNLKILSINTNSNT